MGMFYLSSNNFIEFDTVNHLYIMYFTHARIIKWTQQIGFLTLVEIAQVIEGNYGNDLKEGWQEFYVYRVWRNLIIIYIFIFMRANKKKIRAYVIL